MRKKQKQTQAPLALDEVRIDKWLWAARFYKTRRVATEMIQRGKIKLNGVKVKPSKSVKIDLEIGITRDGFERIFTVKAISDKRGPAPIAQKLYEETSESISEYQIHQEKMKANPAFIKTDGRPNKKNRRLIHQFKQKNQ